MNLPDGVTRSPEIGRHVTLENCHALQFRLQSRGGEASRSIIVWRDRPKHVRPVDPRKRLRDMRPGDRVVFIGKEETVVAVEVYR